MEVRECRGTMSDTGVATVNRGGGGRRAGMHDDEDEREQRSTKEL